MIGSTVRGFVHPVIFFRHAFQNTGQHRESVIRLGSVRAMVLSSQEP